MDTITARVMIIDLNFCVARPATLALQEVVRLSVSWKVVISIFWMMQIRPKQYCLSIAAEAIISEHYGPHPLGMWKRLTASILEDGIATSI